MTIGGIRNRVCKGPESWPASSLGGLMNIGLDGTDYEKAHKYMSVVTNIDIACAIWRSAGCGKEAFTHVIQKLENQTNDNITRHMSMLV